MLVTCKKCAHIMEHLILTHWGRDKMAAISQTTLSIAFFVNENVRILIIFSLKFVPRGSINNTPALVQIMAWRRWGDKPLSEPMMVRLPTHICVTRPQWVNILHIQHILSHWGMVMHMCQCTGSSLVQVMVCYISGTKSLTDLMLNYQLTHCGLLMTYGDKDLGQHWLK